MRTSLVFSFAVAIVGLLTPQARGAEPSHRKLSAVPFTEVKLQDPFWAPRMEINRVKSLPHNFKWCEQTGRINNFLKAAGQMKGDFEGIYFNDSDVYKVLEGAAYSLAVQRDPELEATVDEVIAKIAAAQQKDGYLNSYYTLVEPDNRWTDCGVKHELYCAGHLIEAAVAHYRATGKRTLLDVAIRFANYIDETFGPDRKHDVPGHEEIELALVKLYQVTGDERYMKLATFFIEMRGNEAARPKIYGEYCQDHLPVREQNEIVGHAVRAMYLYSGVADVAGYSGDRPLIQAMDRLWQSVAQRKMYITGGIGVQNHGEGFSGDYVLPNADAYCETCAAIGMVLWSHRLNLLHADAQYADVMERAMYNGVISGIDLSGEKFFYVNPLASSGNHHRQPFYDCACCPTNVVRFISSVPGYVYTVSEQGVSVNLYAAGVGKIKTADGTELRIVQETDYPWDGKVRLTLDSASATPQPLRLSLRIPDWCEEAKLAVNSQAIDPLTVSSGYVHIDRTWQRGDTVELELPMTVRRVEAHPRVQANQGRVAVQRGPIVYCFEQIDNELPVQGIVLPSDPKFVARHRPDLLGGVTVIEGVDRAGRKITGIPYYAWDHREPGAMVVWVRQDGKPRTPDVADPAWQGQLYRTLDPASLGPSTPLATSEASVPSASHCWQVDSIDALNDRVEPASSQDRNVPRFTWWDHRGTTEWVQYTFDVPRTVSATEVYWYDDTGSGQCRVPQSWRLLYRDGDAWKPVRGASSPGTELDKFNRVEFSPVQTSALRIEAQLQPEFSAGVLEWKVE